MFEPYQGGRWLPGSRIDNSFILIELLEVQLMVHYTEVTLWGELGSRI